LFAHVPKYTSYSDRLLGKIVEVADRNTIYTASQHPYTRALLNAIPIPDPIAEKARQRMELSGDIPNPYAPPAGCRFHTRCPQAEKGLCDTSEPEYREISPGHWIACHLVSA
jgi:oligopeptide/dipeptide ABC transporter ATP-binding protein